MSTQHASACATKNGSTRFHDVDAARDSRLETPACIVPQSPALLLNGNLKELARLTAETERFCQDHSLPVDVEFDLNLVLEELFVNSVNHGGCRDLKNAAEVLLSARSYGIVIEYADRCSAFNPLDAPEPDIVSPLSERPIGGLVIHHKCQIMRDCEYQRTNEWNRMLHGGGQFPPRIR